MTDDGLAAGDTGTVDPRILAIAATITRDWASIDKAWEGVRERCPDLHLQRQSGLDADKFLVQALAQAQSHNLLRTFEVELKRWGLDGDGFPDAFGAVLPARYELQAFLNGTFTPVHAYLYGRGLIEACSQVCRIEIADERAERTIRAGTGVLIRPALVATVAHVVLPLIEKRPDGSHAAKPGTVGRLTLTFGNFQDYAEEDGRPAKPRAGVVAGLHANWLAWVSEPTAIENSKRYDVRNIDGITAGVGPWDVALIRLAQTPEGVLQPSAMRSTPVPGNALAVQILHHPASGLDKPKPLLLSTGKVDHHLGAPPVRCLHTANTLPGSSGAPVYDDTWSVVALHQGGPRQLQHVADAATLAETDRNRAVPIATWLPQIAVIEQSLDHVSQLRLLDDEPWNDPHPHPVIGRLRTRRAVRDALAPDAPTASRLLLVRGPVGSGRRFTRRLVGKLVADAGQEFYSLDLSELTGRPKETVATFILHKVFQSTTTFTSSGMNTGQRYVKEDVASTVVNQLDRHGGSRQVWLLLEGLASPQGDMSPGVRDLLTEVVERLGAVQRVRLVLVGWSEKPPIGFEASVEDLLMPTADDIAEYHLPAGERIAPDLVDKIEAELARIADAEALTGYPAALRVLDELEPLVADGAEGGR